MRTGSRHQDLTSDKSHLSLAYHLTRHNGDISYCGRGMWEQLSAQNTFFCDLQLWGRPRLPQHLLCTLCWLSSSSHTLRTSRLPSAVHVVWETAVFKSAVLKSNIRILRICTGLCFLRTFLLVKNSWRHSDPRTWIIFFSSNNSPAKFYSQILTNKIKTLQPRLINRLLFSNVYFWNFRTLTRTILEPKLFN